MIVSTSIIEVTILSKEVDTVPTADGQIQVEGAPNDRIRIHAEQDQVTFLNTPNNPFFSILRQKMQWSGSTSITQLVMSALVSTSPGAWCIETYPIRRKRFDLGRCFLFCLAGFIGLSWGNRGHGFSSRHPAHPIQPLFPLPWTGCR